MITPRQAEVAGEHFLRSLNCTHTRRAVRTKWQHVDFFASDVMGRGHGVLAWAQVTTAQNSGNVLVRKKKLEKYPWQPIERVFVLEVEERQNVIRQRQKDFFFRVHEYGVVLTGFPDNFLQFNPGTDVTEIIDPGDMSKIVSLQRRWSIWNEPFLITKTMLKPPTEHDE